MDALLNGILLGLTLAVAIGPVFFALLQNSVERGFFAGLFMAIGISLSDSAFFFLAYLGLSPLLENENFQQWLELGGAIVLVAFGLIYVFKPVAEKGSKQASKPEGRRKGAPSQIMKGFLLNAINPAVVLFWAGIVTSVSSQYSYSREQVFVFFIGIILTVFTTDILKVYLAQKLNSLITTRTMLILNRTVGMALFLFGLKTLIYSYLAYMQGPSY